MDLGLEITPGRRRRALEVEVVREVELGDLLAPREPVQPVEITRVTERHHALARLLAAGVSNDEAAAVLGYTASRVSILKGSPAFQELLDLYRERKEIEFADFASRLAGLSKDAVVELQTRLEEAPEQIGTALLLEIVKTTADRTGFGPSSKQETTVKFDLADRLKAARERVAGLKDVTPGTEIIDVRS